MFRAVFKGGTGSTPSHEISDVVESTKSVSSLLITHVQLAWSRTLQVQSVSSKFNVSLWHVYCIALTEPLTIPTVPDHILIPKIIYGQRSWPRMTAPRRGCNRIVKFRSVAGVYYTCRRIHVGQLRAIIVWPILWFTAQKTCFRVIYVLFGVRTKKTFFVFSTIFRKNRGNYNGK